MVYHEPEPVAEHVGASVVNSHKSQLVVIV